MTGHKYILSKQTQWAKNNRLKLIGSQNNRGLPHYTSKLNDNLFSPLLPETRASFSKGDGKELGTGKIPGKMQAIHSSSAIGVNVFQYWKVISKVNVIASACEFCNKNSNISIDIKFEDKYPIHDSLSFSPNIDVVIYNKPETKIKRFAVECKFSEAYGAYKHGGLKNKYIELNEIWKGLPNLRAFAKSISPQDNKYKHLHPAQLVKHILGLKRQFNKDGFRLLYLWYDVLGEDGKRHQDEIDQFINITKKDKIKFHALTYQELIIKMASQLRNSHKEYIKYLTGRYL
jgi:hypothetical protein